MDHAQRYVSSELSHFVGRGRTDEEQYDLLVNKILKGGWLTYGPRHDPTISRSARLDFSKPLSEDKALVYQVVCFCDIPEPDLALHVNKYSKFGLAFKKEFLVDAGACPVFYVANDSPVTSGNIGLFRPGDFSDRVDKARAKGSVDRALYFDTSFRGLVDLFAAFDAIFSAEDKRYFSGALPVAECKKRLGDLLGLTEAQVESLGVAVKGNVQAAETISICRDFLLHYVFSFVKCFDAKRDVGDIAHYYMEREWRVADNVRFSLNDVSRVFFPAIYAKKFRADLPAYTGQISFIG